jgi:hypothetical protein
MQIFHHRRRPEAAAPAGGPEDDGLVTAAPTPGVPVLLSPGVVELEAGLSRELGPGFSVQTEGPGADGVMVVGPLGPAAMAFLRASHPGVVLLVVDRRWHVPNPNEAVIHLEAGADGYLASPMVAEVASHVRALVRRRRLAVL